MITEEVKSVMGWYGDLEKCVDLDMCDLRSRVLGEREILSLKYHIKSCESSGLSCVDCIEGVHVPNYSGTRDCVLEELDKLTNQSSYHIFKFTEDEYFILGTDESWGLFISFKLDPEWNYN